MDYDSFREHLRRVYNEERIKLNSEHRQSLDRSARVARLSPDLFLEDFFNSLNGWLSVGATASDLEARMDSFYQDWLARIRTPTTRRRVITGISMYS